MTGVSAEHHYPCFCGHLYSFLIAINGVLATTLSIETFPNPDGKLILYNRLSQTALIAISGGRSPRRRLRRASGTPIVGPREPGGGAIRSLSSGSPESNANKSVGNRSRALTLLTLLFCSMTDQYMETGHVIRITGMSLSLSRFARNPLAHENGAMSSLTWGVSVRSIGTQPISLHKL